MKTYKISGNYPFQRSILNTVLIAALFLAVTLSPLAYSHGQGTEKSAEAVAATAEQKNRAKELTLQLGTLLAEYKATKATESSSLSNQLVTIAKERQELMLELIKNDPAEALRLTLPEKLRVGMPLFVQSYLEQYLELDGEIEVLHQDYENMQTQLQYFLNSDGKRISLHFGSGAPALFTDQKVRADGIFLNDGKSDGTEDAEGVMALASADSNIQLLAADGSTITSTSTTSTTIAPNTFGVQKTLVLLVNFQDKVEEPFTEAQTNDLVFNTVNNYYYENSYRQTSLSGVVRGWYTLPISSSSSRTQIADAADAAAAANGVALSTYTRIVYIFPKIAFGGAAGMASLGGNPSRAWINGKLTLKVIGHELGHNFGLGHSHGLNCTGGVVTQTCNMLEYGDNPDIMGGMPAHINSYQKEKLGWLGYGSSPAIKAVETDGAFTIEPYESVSQGLKALKVLRSIDSVTGQKTWFYLEYRQPIGLDDLNVIIDRWNVFNGVLFRMATEQDPNGSQLLDMTPDSFDDSIDFFQDLSDPALVSGSTYQDPDGVAITTESNSSSGAKVNIGFGQPNCVHNNPLVSLTPSESLWVGPGAPVSFDVTVKNTDSSACPDTTFDLSGSLPQDWTSGFGAQSLTIAPGMSATTIFSVTSTSSAADGFYNIGVSAKNHSNSAYSATGTATYVVSAASGDQPPVAVNDSSAALQGTATNVYVKSNDSDPNGDPLTVVSVTKPANGTVIINADNSVNYTPAKRFKGIDTFNYTISDGQLTANAVVTVTVSGSSVKGGK